MSNTTVTLGPAIPFTPRSDANVVGVGTKFTSDGSWVTSKNEEYVLILQTDGNLVLYRVIGNPPPFEPGAQFNGEPKWATGTDQKGGRSAVLQEDGNLVVLDQDDNPVWASQSSGIECLGLYVQDDGNVVIYKPAAVWAAIKS